MTKKKSSSQTKDHSLESFEEKLHKLEGLVNKLDSSEVKLQESLALFEQGVELYKECYAVITKAEKKVQVLSDSLELADYQEKED